MSLVLGQQDHDHLLELRLGLVLKMAIHYQSLLKKAKFLQSCFLKVMLFQSIFFRVKHLRGRFQQVIKLQDRLQKANHQEALLQALNYQEHVYHSLEIQIPYKLMNYQSLSIFVIIRLKTHRLYIYLNLQCYVPHYL